MEIDCKGATLVLAAAKVTETVRLSYSLLTYTAPPYTYALCEASTNVCKLINFTLSFLCKLLGILIHCNSFNSPNRI